MCKTMPSQEITRKMADCDTEHKKLGESGQIKHPGEVVPLPGSGYGGT